jgi:methyl-accepting chemotaxis protein
MYTAVRLNNLSKTQDDSYSRSEDALVAETAINRKGKEAARDWTEIKSWEAGFKYEIRQLDDKTDSLSAKIKQLTQQNAASSEEMASSTEELSSQAEELKRMVTQFKV